MNPFKITTIIRNESSKRKIEVACFGTWDELNGEDEPI
jgi:hypothetical protein